MEVPQKTKNRTTIWSSNPTLKHISSKAKIQKDTYTSVFIAALFTTAKTWKRSRLPSTDEWIKMWCIYIKYTADYYLAVKKKDIMPLASTWTDLEIIGLRESERDKYHMVLTFMGNLKYDRNLSSKTETDSRIERTHLWLPRGRRVEEGWTGSFRFADANYYV